MDLAKANNRAIKQAMLKHQFCRPGFNDLGFAHFVNGISEDMTKEELREYVLFYMLTLYSTDVRHEYTACTITNMCRDLINFLN